MAQHNANRAEKQEHNDSERHPKKKESQLLLDQLKTTDEGLVPEIETPFFPLIEEHAMLLTQIKSDQQRANLAIHLQQSYGNRYVQRLLSSRAVQAKLSIGQPGDIYEKEADMGAERAIQEKAFDLQKQPLEELEEEEEMLQPKASDIQRQKAEAPPSVTMTKEKVLQRFGGAEDWGRNEQAPDKPSAAWTKEKVLQYWQQDVAMGVTRAWVILGEGSGKASDRAFEAQSSLNQAKDSLLEILPQYNGKPVLKNLKHLQSLCSSASASCNHHMKGGLSLEEIRDWIDPHGKPFGTLMNNILPRL